jgi:hypothetical protein
MERPVIRTYYRRSEVTAVSVTYRNAQGWPFNLTHAQYEILGKPINLAIDAIKLTEESEDDRPMEYMTPEGDWVPLTDETE